MGNLHESGGFTGLGRLQCFMNFRCLVLSEGRLWHAVFSMYVPEEKSLY